MSLTRISHRDIFFSAFGTLLPPSHNLSIVPTSQRGKFFSPSRFLNSQGELQVRTLLSNPLSIERLERVFVVSIFFSFKKFQTNFLNFNPLVTFYLLELGVEFLLKILSRLTINNFKTFTRARETSVS